MNALLNRVLALAGKSMPNKPGFKWIPPHVRVRNGKVEQVEGHYAKDDEAASAVKKLEDLLAKAGATKKPKTPQVKALPGMTPLGIKPQSSIHPNLPKATSKMQALKYSENPSWAFGPGGKMRNIKAMGNPKLEDEIYKAADHSESEWYKKLIEEAEARDMNVTALKHQPTLDKQEAEMEALEPGTGQTDVFGSSEMLMEKAIKDVPQVKALDKLKANSGFTGNPMWAYGPSGKMRNIKAMGDEKLSKELAKLQPEHNGGTWASELRKEAKNRGMLNNLELKSPEADIKKLNDQITGLYRAQDATRDKSKRAAYDAQIKALEQKIATLRAKIRYPREVGSGTKAWPRE